MKLAVRLVCLLALIAASACASPPQTPTPTPDPEIARLLVLVEQQSPGAVLHQIDTYLRQTCVRFTDRAATEEISIRVPSAGAPTDQWAIEVNQRSPRWGI